MRGAGACRPRVGRHPRLVRPGLRCAAMPGPASPVRGAAGRSGSAGRPGVLRGGGAAAPSAPARVPSGERGWRSAGAGRIATLSHHRIASLEGLERFPSRACQLPGARGGGETMCGPHGASGGHSGASSPLPFALNHSWECFQCSVLFSESLRRRVRYRGVKWKWKRVNLLSRINHKVFVPF